MTEINTDNEPKVIALMYNKGYITSKDLESCHNIADTVPECIYYNKWLDLLTILKVPVGPLLDALDGLSMGSIDRRFKKANGWARRQIITAIKQYTWICEVNGRI